MTDYTADQRIAQTDRAAKYAAAAVAEYLSTIKMEHTEIFLSLTISNRETTGRVHTSYAFRVDGCRACLSAQSGQQLIDMISDIMLQMTTFGHTGPHIRDEMER